jgi:hypothetical protein
LKDTLLELAVLFASNLEWATKFMSHFSPTLEKSKASKDEQQRCQ